MSKGDAPPAYGAEAASKPESVSSKGQGNERPLPDGWVKQFDTNYNQYFYVDTRSNPPRSTWVHPDDEQGKYSAPSGAPPGQQSSRYGSGSGPGPQSSYQPQQQGYMPQQQGYMAQGGYPQQQYVQPVMVQQPYSSGMGMGSGRFGGMGGGLGGMGGGLGGLGGGRMGGGLGTGLLGGGAGLLGGFALAEGMEHMQENAYDQGYMQGDMNGDMGGGDMGGGDMGGGDMGGGGDF
ncbi:hypothetical protein MYAM1_000745 [Malassezia yamatoensis]|uniref:WW domain-containing protein n=1 Tax=Malassezia yamatoensis TaxID=253288 RepID=A0AAJ6CFR6_9BASI|nr:hypothetical protein MYAM1_000745 [Malassezia yamatoensis]